jgi:hypothetical protein
MVAVVGFSSFGERAPLLAQALFDPEDRPPLRRGDHEFCTCWECSQPDPNFRDLLILMPNDQDERETDTVPPDTDRAERETTPPDPIEEAGAREALKTMLPAAPSLPPSPAPPEYWKAAYDKLVEIHEESRKDRDSRQAREDALVGRFVAATKESSDANRDDLMAALGEVTKSVENMGTKLVDLEKHDAAHDERLNEGEVRFKQIEDSIIALKDDLFELVTREMKSATDKIQALEKLLAEAKANAGPPATTAPSSTS